MDSSSLAHTKWNCKYHIVFAPKYRRQVIYKQISAGIGQIIRTLCTRKGVTILEAAAMPDHIHLYVEIPPKYPSKLYQGGTTPIAKMKWPRRLAVAFCTMLLLCTALSTSAYADNTVHINTAYQPFMYFECNEPGVWGDLGTPPHSVVETGQPAYCLQMSMESPYGDGYDATDGSQYYTPTILNGLKAILAHGYPASTGGFTDNEAQYATVNAIRYAEFRANGDGENKRDAKDIPVQEAANAVLRALEEQFSLPQEDLIRSCSKSDGYQQDGLRYERAFHGRTRVG